MPLQPYDMEQNASRAAIALQKGVLDSSIALHVNIPPLIFGREDGQKTDGKRAKQDLFPIQKTGLQRFAETL